MATVTQRPDNLSLLRNLKSYKINTSAAITFKLLKGNDTVIEETYHPDGTNVVTIDIQEDGTVFIAGVGGAGEEAAERIKAIVKVPEAGEEYTGRVVGIQAFGAFVELLPGKDGLLHISRVANGRVDKVEDVLNIGDEVKVKVLEVDEKGKISLDRIDKPEAPAGAGRREERTRRKPGDNGGQEATRTRRPRRRHSSGEDQE